MFAGFVARATGGHSTVVEGAGGGGVDIERGCGLLEDVLHDGVLEVDAALPVITVLEACEDVEVHLACIGAGGTDSACLKPEVVLLQGVFW